MDENELLKHVAPCSLLCYTCGRYKDGIMSRLSKDLLHYTEGVYEFFDQHLPSDEQKSLERFKTFREILRERRDASCEGCRSGQHNGCSIKGCFINECVLEQGVDFCGECSNFPCGRINGLFEEEVYLQWLDGNKQIKEIGALNFYEIRKSESHYSAYTYKATKKSGSEFS